MDPAASSQETSSVPARWTPESGGVLERLHERKAARLRFLHALYEASEGSTSSIVSTESLGASVGLGVEQTWIVRRYLAMEDLLKGVTPTSISITHKGLKEVEEALVAPARPTEHFPPAQNVIVIGTAEGAVIQQGNVDSTQQVTIAPAKLEEARRQAAELEERIRAVEAEGGDIRQLLAEATTARAQLGSARPRLAAVRETVTAVQALLESAVASGKAATTIIGALGAARALLAFLR
jgi:hypothetical protein